MQEKTNSDYNNVIARLLIVLAMGVSLSLLFYHASVTQAQTQPVDKPCTPPSWAPARAIQLIEKISRSESADKPRGEFRKAEFIITMEGNEQVCLASTLDGRGDLWVDDFIEFHVTHQDQTVGSWTHDFYDPNVKDVEKIRAYPAQDLTRLFRAGSNAGYVRLIDFFPPWYSASPVWLVIWGPRPTPTPTPTYTPTSTFTSTPTRTYTPTPSPTPTPTPTPLAPAEIGKPNITWLKINVGPPPLNEWLELMFTPIEQGQSYTFTVPITSVVSSPLNATASVTDNEGETIVERIVLTRQKNKNIFEGQIPAISRTGTYSLTVQVEGTDVTGRKGTASSQPERFVVGWPFWTRPIRGLLALLVIYLLYLITIKPVLIWLFFRDLGKRLVIGELRVKWPLEKKDLQWNLSGSYLAKELSIGIDSGDISLPALSAKADTPRGIFGKLKGNLENRRRQVAPVVVSTMPQVPVLVNGENTPTEKKGLIWSLLNFLAPLPQKPQGIALANGSIIEVGGYSLEYILTEEV
jgi:hypothetical protein